MPIQFTSEEDNPYLYNNKIASKLAGSLKEVLLYCNVLACVCVCVCVGVYMLVYMYEGIMYHIVI